MARTKTTLPKPSREKGERNLDLPLYIDRILPSWSQPKWLEAKIWRDIVARQPFAVDCRDVLTAGILALDWKIEPRDSTKRDEYKSEIEYYTKFLEYTGEYEYAEIIEWICKDALDLPFGSGTEMGREGDRPNGRVLWLEPLDGGTLYPTLNKNYPIGQSVPESGPRQVYFPAHAINRIYYAPRTEIKRKGWGMPPPEKVYLALELLTRGDVYYANLLLDTPEAGILDLGDMAKDSAEEWVKAWRQMLTGIDAYKIPVLYEHEKSADWIAFTRSPTEIMYDKAIYKYAALVSSAYGMSMSDLGMGGSSSGGETLAGTIRDERRTKRTGFAKLKLKLTAWFNRILPPYLQFNFIDLDDELSVALGRARLANATAFGAWINNGVFTEEEARMQSVSDGLITIPVPEKLPEEAKQRIANKNGNNAAERPSMLGRPVSPSSGGFGEVAARGFAKKLRGIASVEDEKLLRLMYVAYQPVAVQVEGAIQALEPELISAWDIWHDSVLWGKSEQDIPIPELTKTSNDAALYSINQALQSEGWWKFGEIDVLSEELRALVDAVHRSFLEEREKILYVLGKADNEGEMISVNDVMPKVTDYVVRLIGEIPQRVGIAVVSGVRRYLLEHESSQDDIIFSEEALITVRQSLEETMNATEVEFADKIAGIISETLEGA